MDLAEKSRAELDKLADELRARISRDPQYPRAELEDVVWELEKRDWRENLHPHSMLGDARTATTATAVARRRFPADKFGIELLQ